MYRAKNLAQSRTAPCLPTLKSDNVRGNTLVSPRTTASCASELSPLLQMGMPEKQSAQGLVVGEFAMNFKEHVFTFLHEDDHLEECKRIQTVEEKVLKAQKQGYLTRLRIPPKNICAVSPSEMASMNPVERAFLVVNSAHRKKLEYNFNKIRKNEMQEMTNKRQLRSTKRRETLQEQNIQNYLQKKRAAGRPKKISRRKTKVPEFNIDRRQPLSTSNEGLPQDTSDFESFAKKKRSTSDEDSCNSGVSNQTVIECICGGSKRDMRQIMCDGEACQSEQKWYHIRCVGVSKRDYKQFQKDPNHKWLCKDCTSRKVQAFEQCEQKYQAWKEELAKRVIAESVDQEQPQTQIADEADQTCSEQSSVYSEKKVDQTNFDFTKVSNPWKKSPFEQKTPQLPQVPEEMAFGQEIPPEAPQANRPPVQTQQPEDDDEVQFLFALRNGVELN